MKRKISLIGINLLAIALMIGHLLYVAIVYPSDTAIMVNIGIAAFYAVALFLVVVGFLLAWLIRKKKQSKFKVLFLILNGIVLLSMIITVAYVVLSYDAMETSASQDVYFLLSLLFLPPLFITDAVTVIVYWIRKKWKKPQTSCN